MVQFEVLGSLRAKRENAPVDLGGPRRRDLLALLLVSRGEAVPLERLADSLWEGDPPATATPTLRAHVSHLRTALGDTDAITTAPGGYRLQDNVEVDAGRFVSELVAARARHEEHDLQGSWELYTSALERWRGEPYADVTLDSLDLSNERQRLNGLRLQAQRERSAVGLELGRHRELVSELRDMVVDHPYDEELAQLLASALYGIGRQADALGVLRRLRSVLADELGLEPNENTRELEMAILRQELGAGPQRPNPVPAPVGATVGRDEEIARTRELVANERMITLVGPGGTGKTRVALEAARAVADQFGDGAAFVSFAQARDKAAVVEHLAGSLRLAGQVGRSTRRGIVEFLRRRNMLLVLDSCEHLIEPIGMLVEWLTSMNEDVTVLATSRERLGCPGEVVVPVPPLPVGEPAEPGAAVELFIDRARRRSPDFDSDRADTELIAEICRRV
ncbi:MAG: BTAD domain-containing putative transcriptional regulator, partial [Nitriliruptorales bacterium]|nr:BTAD domain-containing putative transcriptional regulator [Nitriliruptorales bacterium]